MKIYISAITMDGANAPQENPLPIFRDPQHHQTFHNDGTLTANEQVDMGKNTGFRVLPYCMQDRFTRVRTKQSYQTIVLENDYLRAEFLPELGGRLYSLFDKKKNQELLFKNPVFQPANLSIRNAWFSGGIEWNVGQLGHTYSTCDKVFFARCKTEDGVEFLRMYDYLRTTGLFWQVDFYLPNDARFLFAHICLHNDTNADQPLYWWSNIAVQEKGARIFSESQEIIYINPTTLVNEGDVHAYGHAKMPHLPTMSALDVSYPEKFPYTSEYFFENTTDISSPWESAVYPDGHVFVERSTQPLRVRKMFCWGQHLGGRNWLDHLSLPGEGNYVEIQAGLTPTQIHGADLKSGTKLRFTQAFGSAQMDEAYPTAAEWVDAKKWVEKAIEQMLPADIINQNDRQYTLNENCHIVEQLAFGHGWGMLETVRREQQQLSAIPQGLSFSLPRLGAQEEVWLNMLYGKALNEIGQCELPTSWMSEASWRQTLENIVRKQPYSAIAKIYLGVLEYENGNHECAISLWQKSIAIMPTVIAFRCLAVDMQRQNEPKRALELMKQAFALENDNPSVYITEELFVMLQKAGELTVLWRIYKQLPIAIANDERIMILAGSAALNAEDEDFLLKLFAHPFAIIREGETQMSDLWFRYRAWKESILCKTLNLENIEKNIRATETPPKSIDFRLVVG